MRFKVRLNEEEKEIEVVRRGDRLLVRYVGYEAEARLIHQNGAHFVLEVEETMPGGFVRRKRIRAAGLRNGGKRQLWANGRLVSYELLQEGAAAQTDVETASLSASIPAVVSELLVQVGDEVRAGDRLILLESMKMILPIVAPYDGNVAAINCEPGQAVQPGIRLVDITKVES